MTVRVALVPSTPALLPEHAGIEDPLPEVRAACRAAVAWLVAEQPEVVRVVAAPARPADTARGVTTSPAERVGAFLLEESGYAGTVDAAGGVAVLVVANGSACRSEKAPGHLDERAAGFDAVIEQALAAGRFADLADLDEALAEELWCHDASALRVLASLGEGSGSLDLAADPYGVRYWVGRWTCGSSSTT